MELLCLSAVPGAVPAGTELGEAALGALLGAEVLSSSSEEDGEGGAQLLVAAQRSAG